MKKLNISALFAIGFITMMTLPPKGFAATGLDIVASSSKVNAVNSEQLKEYVALALDKFEQTPRKNWQFTVNRYENEEGEITSSTERYTPSDISKERWTLIRSNDQAPTKKQQQEFQKKKLKAEQRKESGNNFSAALREIINIDSLSFASENAEHILMHFDVYLKKLGDDAKGKLRGTLTFNKNQRFIERMVIENTQEFSPVFSANIAEFKLSFDFININEHILPQQQDMQMKGSFAIFTEIDEVSTDSFSDYQLKL